MDLRTSIRLGSIFLAAVLAACASGQSEGGGDETEQKTGVRWELECSGGAVLKTIYNETNSVKESGPVQLPAGKDCSAAAKLPESTFRKFAKEGEWTLFWKGTTTPLRRGRYVNDEREGEWLAFNKKGQRTAVVTYSGGKKNGPETEFFDGTEEWKERGQNVSDERDGPWEIRHSQKSDCISQGSYSIGKKTGPWQECEKDNKSGEWYVRFKGTYREGLKDGPGVVYDPDGNKIAEGSFYADTSDDCKQNPPKGQYDNCGKRTGEWKIYFPDGKLAMTGSYSPDSGNRVGTWTEYYRSGEKMAKGPRDHTRQGDWTFWDKSGKIIFEGTFAGNDFNPRQAVLYENGRKVAAGEISVGLVKYSVDEDKFIIGTMVKAGVWKLFDERGRMTGEGEMVAGKKNGEWKELKSNGKYETVCYMLGRERGCQ